MRLPVGASSSTELAPSPAGLLVRVLVVPVFVVVLLVGVAMVGVAAVQRSAVRRSAGQRVVGAPVSSSPGGASPTGSADLGRPMAIGAYSGPGNLAGVRQLSAALPGGVSTAFDYLSDATWATIADPAWVASRWSSASYPMIFGVPMLPSAGATLAKGAAGEYDEEFASLAKVLVASHEGDATLVLGWSPLVRGLPWSVSTPAQANEYAAFYRRIVGTMRVVPGSRLSFAYQPGPVASGEAERPSELYPGRHYVADIATSVFDVLESKVAVSASWPEVATAPYGPDWLARFARRLGRPLIVDALALVPRALGGGGDDPGFVAAFLSWARREDVTSVILWDYGALPLSPERAPLAFGVIASDILRGDGRK